MDRVANDAADQNIVVTQNDLVEQGNFVNEALKDCQKVDGKFFLIPKVNSYENSFGKFLIKILEEIFDQ